MFRIYEIGHYYYVANSLYTFSSTPFLHDENFAATTQAAFYFTLFHLLKNSCVNQKRLNIFFKLSN